MYGIGEIKVRHEIIPFHYKLRDTNLFVLAALFSVKLVLSLWRIPSWDILLLTLTADGTDDTDGIRILRQQHLLQRHSRNQHLLTAPFARLTSAHNAIYVISVC